MLDQNTDRMWYVIGAVLIGAGIILGANILFPNAFASISESFDTVSNETSLVMDKYPQPNLLKVSDLKHIYSYSSFSMTDLSEVDLRVTNSKAYLLHNATGGIAIYYDFKPNTNYVFHYSYQKTAGELQSFGGHIPPSLTPYRQNSVYVDGVLNSNNYFANDSAFVGDDFDVHTVEVHFKTESDMFRVFDFWIQPNRGSYVDVDVKIYNIKLEEGTIATPFR